LASSRGFCGLGRNEAILTENPPGSQSVCLNDRITENKAS
jgi:hypothetical protein